MWPTSQSGAGFPVGLERVGSRRPGRQPGRPQRSLDKQFLRDWSAGLDWDRRPPGPAIPPEIVAATRDRYLELLARLTGP